MNNVYWKEGQTVPETIETLAGMTRVARKRNNIKFCILICITKKVTHKIRDIFPYPAEFLKHAA